MTSTCNSNDTAAKDDGHYCYTSTDSYTFTTPVARASQVFAICVLLILCLAANALMIYAVLSTRNRGSAMSASSLLLINLATTDLLVGTLVLPMWIVSTATLSWPLPKVLCGITAFLTVALMVCSILSLSAIAVDRYLNLAYPLRYPTEVTTQRLAIALVSIWALGFLVAGLPLCGWGSYRFQPQTVPICNPVWVSEVGFSAFLMLCGLTAPFLVMLASYVRIVQIAKRHIDKIEATQSIAVGSLSLERYDSCPHNNNNINAEGARDVSDMDTRAKNVDYDAERVTNVCDKDTRVEHVFDDATRVTHVCNNETKITNICNNDTGITNRLQGISESGMPVIQSNENIDETSAPKDSKVRGLPISAQNYNVGTRKVVLRSNMNTHTFVQNASVKIGSTVQNDKTKRTSINNSMARNLVQQTNKKSTQSRKKKSAGVSNSDFSQHNGPDRHTKSNRGARHTNGEANIISNDQRNSLQTHNDISNISACKVEDIETVRQSAGSSNRDHSTQDVTNGNAKFSATVVREENNNSKTMHNIEHAKTTDFHAPPGPKVQPSSVFMTKNSGASLVTPSLTSQLTTDSSSRMTSYLSPNTVTSAKKKNVVTRSQSKTGLATKRIFFKSVKTANRVFVAVGLFFLCWGPYVTLNVWSVNNETEPVPYSADLLTTLLAFANSAINPVLFLIINRDYRRTVRKLGRKCWKPCLHRGQHRYDNRMGSGVLWEGSDDYRSGYHDRPGHHERSGFHGGSASQTAGLDDRRSFRSRVGTVSAVTPVVRQAW
ncbi:uncharacterized protein [Littorina saxatilis]|uniref:uncharacterized protein n=1 Tax=Littorina saxatilis TaxID=31220 RepID=UPI0038B54BA0